MLRGGWLVMLSYTKSDDRWIEKQVFTSIQTTVMLMIAENTSSDGDSRDAVI